MNSRAPQVRAQRQGDGLLEPVQQQGAVGRVRASKKASSRMRSSASLRSLMS
jgi:hypothetical protein